MLNFSLEILLTFFSKISLETKFLQTSKVWDSEVISHDIWYTKHQVPNGEYPFTI